MKRTERIPHHLRILHQIGKSGYTAKAFDPPHLLGLVDRRLRQPSRKGFRKRTESVFVGPDPPGDLHIDAAETRPARGSGLDVTLVGLLLALGTALFSYLLYTVADRLV